MPSQYDTQSMRFSARPAAAALIALIVTPVFAGAQSDVVDGWARTRSETGCLTTYVNGPPPFLSLHDTKDGKVQLALNGLNATTEQMLAGSYSAVATVKLNGNTAFAKSTRKSAGSVVLDITLKELQALTQPGQIMFEVQGDGGQHESIAYASPGLASAVTFLSECIAR